MNIEHDFKPGDNALLWGDVEVVILAVSDTSPDVFHVRYAHKDNFGEKASFYADRCELTPKGASK